MHILFITPNADISNDLLSINKIDTSLVEISMGPEHVFSFCFKLLLSERKKTESLEL